MSQRAPWARSQTDLGLNCDTAPCYDLGKVTSLGSSGLLCEKGIIMSGKKCRQRPLLEGQDSAALAWEEKVCGRIREAHSALREKIRPIKGKSKQALHSY